jgi:hypothetical protein
MTEQGVITHTFSTSAFCDESLGGKKHFKHPDALKFSHSVTSMFPYRQMCAWFYVHNTQRNMIERFTKENKGVYHDHNVKAVRDGARPSRFLLTFVDPSNLYTCTANRLFNFDTSNSYKVQQIACLLESNFVWSMVMLCLLSGKLPYLWKKG